MAKKKSYNPFKMWGSYVGLIISLGLSLIYIWLRTSGEWSISGVIAILFFPISWLYNLMVNINPIFSMLLIVLYGFLIGWGIHSIIRSLRK